MTTPDYSSAEGDAYHASRHKEFFENPLLTRAMADFVRLTYFADLKSGQSVLEIGAGLGTNLLAIKDIARVTAVEPSPLAREQCRLEGIAVLASLNDLPKNATFDFVLLRHVIEHVQDPRAMLLSAKPLLAPGGKLIVALPIEPIESAPSPGDIDYHLYSWTRQTIHNLLNDCGYRNISTRLNYRNGRKLLLPIYRAFGAKTYAKAMFVLGRIRGLSEIVVEAYV
jgi:SAM-dependent methyltransferase